MTNNDTPAVSAERLAQIRQHDSVWTASQSTLPDPPMRDRHDLLIAYAALLAANAALQARLADVERYHGEAVQREVALREQVARMEADAARLDWLEDRGRCYCVEVQSQPSGDYIYPNGGRSTLRAAIDTARAGGEV